MSKLYTAVYGTDGLYPHSITTVIADSIEDAREKLTQQLNRPGRWDFYRVWVEQGSQVIERQ